MISLSDVAQLTLSGTVFAGMHASMIWGALQLASLCSYWLTTARQAEPSKRRMIGNLRGLA